MTVEFIKAALVTSLVLAPVAAKAERQVLAYRSGSDLYQLCKAEQGTWRSVECRGYISGAVDMLSSLFGQTCPIPENSNLTDVQDVVIKLLRDHPEKRRLAAAGLVARAIGDAYCPENNQTTND